MSFSGLLSLIKELQLQLVSLISSCPAVFSALWQDPSIQFLLWYLSLWNYFVLLSIIILFLFLAMPKSFRTQFPKFVSWRIHTVVFHPIFCFLNFFVSCLFVGFLILKLNILILRLLATVFISTFLYILRLSELLHLVHVLLLLLTLAQPTRAVEYTYYIST